jgi:hypothetical protein
MSDQESARRNSLFCDHDSKLFLDNLENLSKKYKSFNAIRSMIIDLEEYDKFEREFIIELSDIFNSFEIGIRDDEFMDRIFMSLIDILNKIRNCKRDSKINRFQTSEDYSFIEKNNRKPLVVLECFYSSGFKDNMKDQFIVEVSSLSERHKRFLKMINVEPEEIDGKIWINRKLLFNMRQRYAVNFVHPIDSDENEIESVKKLEKDYYSWLSSKMEKRIVSSEIGKDFNEEEIRSLRYENLN